MYSDNLNFVEIETAEGVIHCVGGSFRDVPFFVEECVSSGGRNVATSPIPYTSEHVNEDLGQKVREMRLNFYLVGENVEAMREALEEAFNAEGVADLVHPYYGLIAARCCGYTINYTKNEQQYVSGDVTFRPEYKIDKSAVEVDYQGQAEEKANSILDNAKNAFAAAFSLAGKASSIVNSVVDAVNTCLDAVEAARQMMRQVSSFVSNISQIRDNLETLLDTPSEFAARIQLLITDTDNAVTGVDYSVQAQQAMGVMRSVDVADGQMISDELNATFQEFVLMTAAAQTARCAIFAEYENAEAVREMQSNLQEVFELAMQKVNSAENYMNLADLRATVLKYLSDTVSKLAVVVELPLNSTRDVLTLAFDCYGNLDRVDEIISRNAVNDPMVINRRSLKVLSK